jgi:hypothetical protein
MLLKYCVVAESNKSVSHIPFTIKETLKVVGNQVLHKYGLAALNVIFLSQVIISACLFKYVVYWRKLTLNSYSIRISFLAGRLPYFS